MMNQFIKSELDKVKIPFDKVSDNIFVFKKVEFTYTVDFEVGHFYLIEVEDYIIHPYDGFTLHENWNNGIAPTDKNMQIEVVNVMGKMMKIKALGMNDKKMWEGWIPKKSARIIQVVL